MRARTLLAVVAVLVVAGVAVAAAAVVWFLPQQQGTYTGPGIPQAVTGSCDLAGDARWCSQGFQVNATNFTTTMCYSVGTTAPLTVWAYLMNSTSYHEFQVNSTLTRLGNTTAPGCVGPVPIDTGPGAFYWVWVDTTASAVEVDYSVSVLVPA